MIILDTAFHITFDARYSNPEIACTGNCKKVWWLSDFDGRDAEICPQCGSSDLCEAIAKVHYSVVNSANRPLKLSDFTSVTAVPYKDKQSIKNFLQQNGGINTLSVVKPAFVEKARKEWCS